MAYIPWNLSRPSQCCSKAVLRCVFARSLAVISGWGSFIVVWSTAGGTIAPLNAIWECIIPNKDRQKRLISINGFCPQEMFLLAFTLRDGTEKVSSLKLPKRIVNNYILATKTTQKSKMSSAQLLFHTKWITHQCLEATFGTYIILPLNLVLILLPAQCCRCGYQARAEIKRQRSNRPPYCSTATWGAFVVPRQQGNHSGTGAFHSPWSSRRFYEAKLFESITQLAGMVRIETCILGKIEQHK